MKIILVLSIVTLTLTFLSCDKKNNITNSEKITADKDTEKIQGFYVLFLRPDDKKFEAAKNEPGIYETDSDFGFAIQNTIDSLKYNIQFKNIKNNVSTKRYIEIKNCKNCPRIIDRDSILYGMILTAPNKEVKIISGVNALNYLSLIEEYYK